MNEFGLVDGLEVVLSGVKQMDVYEKVGTSYVLVTITESSETRLTHEGESVLTPFGWIYKFTIECYSQVGEGSTYKREFWLGVEQLSFLKSVS